ncbi:MAG: pyruvate dehydrogenase [Myxococcota bacterium]
MNEAELIQRIARRVFVHATKMIWDANNRDDEMEGDPKVGGHPAACSSAVHILSAIHLGMRGPDDMLAVKPHASPVDHSINYALGLLHEIKGRRWLSEAEGKVAMSGLRKFSRNGAPVFQSYHSEWDPDGEFFFPSGSVGIPPVSALYTALAYRYAQDHGLDAPEGAHFWCLMGDSEFREGSLMEAMPEGAEREIGNLTWIVDYNRQNLDGTRIINQRGLHGTDADRIERVSRANGWDVIQVRHGRLRQKLFARVRDPAFQKLFEDGFSDYEIQALLMKRDGKAVREHCIKTVPTLEKSLLTVTDAELWSALTDVGGHDISVLLEAMQTAKKAERRPTMIVAHTLKGWGLEMMAAPGNHSALPEEKEVDALLASEGLSKADPFARFAESSPEGKFLTERGKRLRDGVEAAWARKDKNAEKYKAKAASVGGIPETLGVDLKYLPLVHTQYVWGQLAGKLIRLGHEEEAARRGELKKERHPEDLRWGPPAELVVTMAPDVGTSTNINPAMDDKIYGPDSEPNWEKQLGVGDRRRPVLVPSEDQRTRHIRFEIAESNCMTAVGSFGKLRDRLGVPILPVMTVYDFFIKRALDQLYYNLYWGAGFIVVGTPSGATLSPEGAQHSWKSDIQMPNLITWEPFYAIEVDWILADTVRRHYAGEDQGRSGVILRAVTRAFKQAEMLKHLKAQPRFAAAEESEIWATTRADALAGAYYLIDHRGKTGYEPGENVVNVFSMGAVTSEAIAASERLEGNGIFANVIVVTSADLLIGNLAHEDGYRHLREQLGVSGDLFLTSKKGLELRDRADYVQAAGRRVPIVAVVDGEPGLLDNLGSIVGVKAETLALRKASKSGRPIDVYGYLHIDAEAVYEAAGTVLSETALENVRVSSRLLSELRDPAKEKNGHAPIKGAELWPPRQ